MLSVGIALTLSRARRRLALRALSKRCRAVLCRFAPKTSSLSRLLLYTVLYWSTSLTISKYAKLVVVIPLYVRYLLSVVVAGQGMSCHVGLESLSFCSCA